MTTDLEFQLRFKNPVKVSVRKPNGTFLKDQNFIVVTPPYKTLENFANSIRQQHGATEFVIPSFCLDEEELDVKILWFQFKEVRMLGTELFVDEKDETSDIELHFQVGNTENDEE
jgi:hypothetical protein